jgi:TetR/AcrR family transcriptional repressor of lmrAB and yxaGH operons
MSEQVRTRMIDGAIDLFRSRGLSGTSMSDVVAHSRTPRGSMYHYFPGGKAQLAEEATRRAGELMGSELARRLDRDGPARALLGMIDNSCRVLVDTDFEAGCPILAAGLATVETDSAQTAAAATFAHWRGLIATSLESAGASRARAGSVANLAVAAIEGAIALSRAERSLEPLRRTAAELELTINALVGDRS